MDKYRNGKIYKLIDLTNDNIYIGSTIQTLHDRLIKHKNPSNNCMSNTFKDPYIQLLCNYSCNSRKELLKEEQRYIDMYDCVNKQNAYGDKNRNIYSKYYTKKYRNIEKNKIKINKKQSIKYKWKSSFGSITTGNCLWFINTNLFH